VSSGRGSCGALKSSVKKGVNRKLKNSLRCTGKGELISMSRLGDRTTLTVVVNGITNQEQSTNEGDQRLAGSVGTIEETALDARNAGGSGTLGQLGVEVDQRAQTSTRTAGLKKF